MFVSSGNRVGLKLKRYRLFGLKSGEVDWEGATL
jgi:hypothetical protein